MKVLVTGNAGFIGYHLTKRLLERGDQVIGIDNLNPYYDVSLKEARLAILTECKHFHFIKVDLTDSIQIKRLFDDHTFDVVVHLAAQAGVRYSLTDPFTYLHANLVGFGHILEGCRQHNIKNLVFASSSSVYGANTHYPFSEDHPVDHPVSLYAATKKSNELMAHSYAHLYQLPCTGLRFFTVYGPWGRPDMALFKFTHNILAGKPIDIYNHGNMSRDFTYINDAIDGVILLVDHPAQPNKNWSSDHPTPATSDAPYRIYNIGSNRPIQLMEFITTLEKILGKKAIKNKLPLQAGDVPETFADISRLKNDYGFSPKTSIEEGVREFVTWYANYCQTKALKVG